MSFILNDDYTFKKVKEVTRKNTKHMKYLLSDISTIRKGPLFTLVDDIDFSYKKDMFMIIMDISYAGIDVPCDECISLQTESRIETVEKYYNIFPLIKQMFAFNTYREKNSNIDNQLFIETIRLKYKKDNIVLNEYDSNDAIDKIFRKLKMKTTVRKVLSDDKFLLLHGNTWEICYMEPNLSVHNFNLPYFDLIGIPIPMTESLYLISYDDYYRFTIIRTVSVSIGYSGKDEESCDDDYCILCASTLEEILELCIFIPQMVLLEQHIYRNSMRLTLTIETSYGRRSILIDENETLLSYNMCIFDIIRKLLGF